MQATRTRHQPQRTCIACRQPGDKRGLTRLVRAADGQVQIDPTGRLPGRGAYLHPDAECWQRALSRGDVLARALRTTITPEHRATLLTHAPAPGPVTGTQGTATHQAARRGAATAQDDEEKRAAL